MPDAGAHLWISQADSDRLAALRLYDPADHRTYCQVISKYQQIVEKIVKALAVAARDAGIVTLGGMYKHDLEKMITGLRLMPPSKTPLSIRDRVGRVLDSYWVGEIKALTSLAPKRPAGPGILHARNTEYPFETGPGVWTAPALPESFDPGDVERYRRVAEKVYRDLREIISAVERLSK
jgi:hypothetical protein